MSKKQKEQRWTVSVEGAKATVIVPDEDILDGKKLRMPMRKLVAKLQNACPGNGWQYSDGIRGHDGYSTFTLYRDNN